MGIRAVTARRLTIKIVAQALAERRKLKDTDAHEGEREPTQGPRPCRSCALGAKYSAWDSSLKYPSQSAAQSKTERRIWETRTSDGCLRK